MVWQCGDTNGGTVATSSKGAMRLPNNDNGPAAAATPTTTPTTTAANGDAAASGSGAKRRHSSIMPLASSVKGQVLRLLQRTKSTRGERTARMASSPSGTSLKADRTSSTAAADAPTTPGQVDPPHRRRAATVSHSSARYFNSERRHPPAASAAAAASTKIKQQVSFSFRSPAEFRIDHVKTRSCCLVIGKSRVAECSAVVWKAVGVLDAFAAAGAMRCLSRNYLGQILLSWEHFCLEVLDQLSFFIVS
jgi:hypothetical protein